MNLLEISKTSIAVSVKEEIYSHVTDNLALKAEVGAANYALQTCKAAKQTKAVIAKLPAQDNKSRSAECRKRASRSRAKPLASLRSTSAPLSTSTVNV